MPQRQVTYIENVTDDVGHVLLNPGHIGLPHVTIQVHPDVLVDVDEAGNVVGIELLTLKWAGRLQEARDEPVV